LDFTLQQQQPPKPAALQVDRVFIIDDLDFWWFNAVRKW
jgi:hypothetical protein